MRPRDPWKDADDDARLTDNWPPSQPQEPNSYSYRTGEQRTPRPEGGANQSNASDGYSSGDGMHAVGSYPGSEDGSYAPGREVGLSSVVVYTPEEARAQLDEEALQRLRGRFIEAMVDSYGARELEVRAPRSPTSTDAATLHVAPARPSAAPVTMCPPSLHVSHPPHPFHFFLTPATMSPPARSSRPSRPPPRRSSCNGM